MATLKLTIFKAKVLKDGRHKIRVAVCHKQETCYIVTRFIIDNLSQFKNGQVVKRPDAAMINTKLRNLLNEYQEKLDSIKCISMYDCKQLREILLNSAPTGQTTCSFQEVSQKYISILKNENRNSYALLFERNSKYFTEYAKGNFPLSEINPNIIANYAKYLKREKGLGETSIGMFIARTKVIVNYAKRERMVSYDLNPFENYKIQSASIRELDLSIDNFNKIRTSSPKVKKLIVARDLFCLSFYLGGINLIDLLNIDFRGKDTIEYVRSKSKNTKHGDKRTVIVIHKDAKDIIKEWMNKNTGRLDFGYKFTYPNFSRYISRSLASLAKELGIKERVVYYSARKTFAQFASELGIPDGVIDYCLGHSDKSKGIIRFYTKVKQKQAEIAINRVIDYVNNPEKYKDYIEMKADIMMMKG